MDNYENEYDDDVFSLEEDLMREHRKQWIQYIVVAVCAVCLIGLALYGSIVLTQRRMATQPAKPEQGPVVQLPGVTATTEPGTVPEINTPDVDYWPSDAFPGIPAIESQAFDTRESDGFASIKVPSATARNFSGYIDSLTERGAAVYVRTNRLTVLTYEGVEIHLITGNADGTIELCRESAYAWNDANYTAFPLPESGRLISVEDGTGGGSRVLTYRDATTLEALRYTNALIDEGWTISGSLEPTNNTFTAVYKKNNLQITIDYFMTGSSYQIRLDYLG